ncbi:hypothetical protein [Rugamonas sp.]|uniref:hypothetical protein n=1 Tax=Rugamonas sp. TaxID=1926287 RepID=UPI0025D1E9AE|nr:hypothetical protein [Rugamonas sp.]
MNAATEKKPTITLDKKPSTGEASSPAASEAPTVTPAEKLKASILQLDAERTELVKSTIENMKPGKPLDHAAIREINKIETRKNRLIVARFAGLLKKGDPTVQAIVHQIIEL